MRCAECNSPAEGTDYLCARCRVKLDPKEWDDRARCQESVAKFLTWRGKMFYGFELLFPEGSPWAWLQVFEQPSLGSPDKLLKDPLQSSGDLLVEYQKRFESPRFYVWKHTGDIYVTDGSGAIEDNAVWYWKEQVDKT